MIKKVKIGNGFNKTMKGSGGNRFWGEGVWGEMLN